MPTLDWIGKKAVVNHHRQVPYRLIHCDKTNSVGDPDAGNLLVQGDNLDALKALLPYYAGKVKCIYIDPPYNTGNESWIYNDKVNSPEINAWLGRAVGREAEDLSRHDKWLCMMYPRLRLLKDFLSEDGSIWISIDDNEVHGLKLILDEIFGRRNFISNVIWQKKYAPANDALWLSESHDHIVVYALSKDVWRPNKLTRTDKANAAYKNPDGDERGVWKPGDYTCAKNADERPNLFYPVFNPNTGQEIWPSRSRVWGYGKDEHERHVAEKLIWWGKTGRNAVPSLKRFRNKLRSEGTNAQTVWLWDEVSHTQDGRKEQLSLIPDDPFPTPKPEKLIQRIIELASEHGDLILDTFAGSGTTGAVAHKIGRKHIGVEMGDHAVTHIVPRYRKVIDGDDTGGISEVVGWEGGGGFRFCTLGEPLFDADGNVSEAVTFPDLAAHIFFCDTGSPLPKRVDGSSSLIGSFQGRAIYLLFNREAMGFPKAETGNVLTASVLESLPLPEPGFTGPRVVYGEGCTVPDDRLASAGVNFRQVPYQIEGV
jgi:adenine-specific DNA-methyltransferase